MAKKTKEQVVDSVMAREIAKLEGAVMKLVEAYEPPKPRPDSSITALDKVTVTVAILSLAALEAFAIQKGADGTMFMPIVAAISLLGGVKAKDVFKDVWNRRK